MDWTTIGLVVLMGGVFYFLMIRPQQRKAKEAQSHMSSLEPGSRVMLISGIVATVKYLGDKQAVVEISPGVEMTVDKRAISPQPVVDEFEYADDADADEDATAAPVVAETTFDPTGPGMESTDGAPDAGSVAAEPAKSDETEKTWDNPGTTGN